MAVTVDDAEQLLDDTNDAYIVPSAGTNPLLLSLWLASDNSNTPGTTTHTIGGQTFESNQTQGTSGGSSPYFKSNAHYTTSSGTWPTTGSQTVVLTNSEGLANEGGVIVSLANVNQTTPISGFDAQKNESATTITFSSVDADDGDMIYVIASTDTARTLDANPSAPGTNTWDTAIYLNNSAIVGGGAANGAVYRLPVTDDIVATNITISADSPCNNFAATLVVVEQSVGGGPTTNPKGVLGLPLHGPFGGPI